MSSARTSNAWALDAQLDVGTATGIGVYIRGLLDAFARKAVTIDALRAPWLDPWRFDRRLIWDQALLPWQARASRLLHCTAGTIPLGYRGTLVATVHDVAWLRVQQHTRWYARRYFGDIMLAQYARADRIIVVSEFARQELLELAGIKAERISVVYNGVDAAFAAVARVPDQLQPRILAVGTIEVRKNLALILDAMARMRRRDVRLIVPGPATPYREYCAERARALQIADRVDFLGYISHADLLAEYARASLAVVPSVYEGFGYAAAQALTAGVPCVVSTSAALPEIAGAGARSIAPDDPQAWADHCDEMLDHPERAQNAADCYRPCAIARFDWDTAADKTLAVYAAAQAERTFAGYF